MQIGTYRPRGAAQQRGHSAKLLLSALLNNQQTPLFRCSLDQKGMTWLAFCSVRFCFDPAILFFADEQQRRRDALSFLWCLCKRRKKVTDSGIVTTTLVLLFSQLEHPQKRDAFYSLRRDGEIERSLPCEVLLLKHSTLQTRECRSEEPRAAREMMPWLASTRAGYRTSPKQEPSHERPMVDCRVVQCSASRLVGEGGGCSVLEQKLDEGQRSASDRCGAKSDTAFGDHRVETDATSERCVLAAMRGERFSA